MPENTFRIDPTVLYYYIFHAVEKIRDNSATDYQNIDSYNILNLYPGAADPAGAWEAMIYGKNVLDTVEVTQRGANPGSLSFTGVDAAAGASVASLAGTVVSDYREIGLTAPREFCITFRYNL